MPQPDKKIAVIGAGWSGLAAAVELSRHGQQVHVYEAAKQVGGRARRVRNQQLVADNGQHILLGAYQAFLNLLEVVGLREEECLLRMPLTLSLYQKDRQRVHLKASALPSPLNLLFGLILSRGIPMSDKFRFIRNSRKWLKSPVADERATVYEWLQQHAIPESIQQLIWEPLCLAALNTHPREANAKLFQETLKRTFHSKLEHSDLLLPLKDLSGIFPKAATDFIEKNRGHVFYAQRVTGLHEEPGGWQVETRTSRTTYDAVVIATPPFAAAELLRTQDETLSGKLASFRYSPIVTVYLQYSDDVKLPLPMTGSLDAPIEWFVDRRICGQPGLIAGVISGHGEHLSKPNEKLVEEMRDQLANHFNITTEPDASLVIREKRATFLANHQSCCLRPSEPEIAKNLYLAGDYMDTGLPATLESAIQSGIKAAGKHLETSV